MNKIHFFFDERPKMSDLEYIHQKLEHAANHAERMMQIYPEDSHQVVMAKMDVSYWEYNIIKTSHHH